MPGVDDINVDELMEQVEAPSAPRPESHEEAPAETPEEPAEQKAWEAPEWSHFEWNGKKLFPDTPDKAKTWMSLGYNYSQRLGDLNKTHAEKMAEVEKRAKEIQQREESWGRYQKVDEFAQQNPDWWNHVEQSWQQRANPQLDPNLERVLKPLQEKLGKFEEYFGSIEQQRQVEQTKAADQALDAEIAETRKNFPTIDLSAVDPTSGQTLESQVISHGIQQGLRSFKTAFLDYLGPRLIADAEARGKEAAVKTTQLNAKKGLLGQTPTPTKGIQRLENSRAKSWDAVLEEAKAELGIPAY
jgi:hypothetical protein